MSPQPAILALADGTLFSGYAVGALGQTAAEIVFNTAMTGYQEILSDPSYYQQLITLTTPHIGNVGTHSDDNESSKVFAAGLIVREMASYYSHWHAQASLSDYLKQHNIVAISGVDTRKLTHIVRSRGTQAGAIMAGTVNAKEAITLARQVPSMAGQDLAQQVSCANSYEWNEHDERRNDALYHVVAYDFGIKHAILRLLVERACRLTVVPAHTHAETILALKPDGIFLSNGPGDPEPCRYAIDAIRAFLAKRIPLFGICLGHQLLALAGGGHTCKMKYGHHGANHPVQDLTHRTVMITSQNHGFQVDENHLPESIRITHRSLFDNSIQGIELVGYPAFGFQGHPEASPGPHDMSQLFDQFIALIKKYKTT